MPIEPLAFMTPGTIGGLALKNRLVRAATSETMATDGGDATDDLVRLYSDLARGGAGLIITGHIYVEPRGQYEPRQLGLDHDDRIGPLARVTQAVHRHGGKIFAELSHAGSQSLIPEIVPVAPSIVPNAIFARPPVEMSDAEVEGIVADFGAAAAPLGARALTVFIFTRGTVTCFLSSTRLTPTAAAIVGAATRTDGPDSSSKYTGQFGERPASTFPSQHGLASPTSSTAASRCPTGSPSPGNSPPKVSMLSRSLTA
jgi:hypothetical protein